MNKFIILFIFISVNLYSNKCIIIFENTAKQYDYEIVEKKVYDKFYDEHVDYKGFKIIGTYFMMEKDDYDQWEKKIIHMATGIMLHQMYDSIDMMHDDVYFYFDYTNNRIKIEFNRQRLEIIF